MNKVVSAILNECEVLSDSLESQVIQIHMIGRIE